MLRSHHAKLSAKSWAFPTVTGCENKIIVYELSPLYYPVSQLMRLLTLTSCLAWNCTCFPKCFHQLINISWGNSVCPGGINDSVILKLKMNYLLSSFWVEEVIYCHLACAETVQGPTQDRLYRDMLHSYNRLARPVHNDSQALTVGLGLSLIQLIDVVRRSCVPTLWGFRPGHAKRGPSGSPNVNRPFSVNLLVMVFLFFFL